MMNNSFTASGKPNDNQLIDTEPIKLPLAAGRSMPGEKKTGITTSCGHAALLTSLICALSFTSLPAASAADLKLTTDASSAAAGGLDYTLTDKDYAKLGDGDSIYGAYADSKTPAVAANSSLTIDSYQGSTVFGAIVSGFAANAQNAKAGGEKSENTLTIKNSSLRRPDSYTPLADSGLRDLADLDKSLLAGSGATFTYGKAAASYSRVTITGSDCSYRDVVGGYVINLLRTDSSEKPEAEASHNTVDLNKTTLHEAIIYGGYIYAIKNGSEYIYDLKAVSEYNTVKVHYTASESTTGYIGGSYVHIWNKGESYGSASHNYVEVSSGACFEIAGGRVTMGDNGGGHGLTCGNYVHVKDKGTAYVGGGDVYMRWGTAESSKNTIILESGTHGSLIGGYTYIDRNGRNDSKAYSDSNTVTVSSTSFTTRYQYHAGISGGWTHIAGYGEAHADKNSTTITDVTFDETHPVRNYSHAGAGSASSSYNSLTVHNTTDTKAHEICYIYGGYAEIENFGTAAASYNGIGSCQDGSETKETHGTLTNVSSDVKFAGGWAVANQGEAQADHNVFSLSGIFYNEVYGGHAEVKNGGNDEVKAAASASANSITLTAERVSGDIYGGFADLNGGEKDSGPANADGNSLEIALAGEGCSVYSGRVQAEQVSAGSLLSASQNSLSLNGGTYKDIHGGLAELDGEGTATASRNGAQASSGTGLLRNVAAESFSGGTASVTKGSAEASGNIFTLEGGSFGTIMGGKASVTDGSDAAHSARAEGNELTLSNVQVSQKIYASYADVTGTGSASAKGSTLVLCGGSYEDEIYAGFSKSAAPDTDASSGNTVELYEGSAMPKFNQDATVIFGGCIEGNEDAASSALAGNTLKFHSVRDLTAANIKNFDSFIFELPDMAANDCVLTLTGNNAGGEKTDVSRASVDVQKIANLTGSDGGEFLAGDKVYLIQNSNGVASDGLVGKTVSAQTDVSLEYTLEVKTDANSVYLTRKGEARVLPQTKAVAEGAAAGLALAGESINTAVEFSRIFHPKVGTITPFVHAHASSLRYETGSHINMSSVSLLAGAGYGIDTGAGQLGVGAFFEYGKGSYTACNSFAGRSDIDSDGNAWYMGGGILARMDFVPTGPGHFYIVGSAHMGQLHNEYDSEDLHDGHGRTSKFDLDSPYYSLHAGLGYIWNIAEAHDLELYGKYMWTRVEGCDDTLTTGDKFEFDDMDSSRVRFGARYTYKGSERFRPYIGAAFEHEFAGDCESKTFGHNVAAPSFSGSSGMGELGVTMMPAKTVPLSINLGVQGFVGQKQGVTGSCLIKYEF